MNIKSARKVSEFVSCWKHDEKGRVQKATVPGHNARLYQVTFSRNGKQLVIDECINPDEGEMCKGHKHSICFHALAALIHAASEKEFRLSFCESLEEAEKIKRTGGTIVELISAHSKKKCWVVYQKI